MKDRTLEVMQYLMELDKEELYLFKGVIDCSILRKELEGEKQ